MYVAVYSGVLGQTMYYNTHTHTIVLWLLWILSGTQFFYRPDAFPAIQPTASKHAACYRWVCQ